MEFTKEQEKQFKEMAKINEFETIYICQECKKSLKGMKKVREHCKSLRHYEYKNPKHKGIIGFV